MHLLPTVTLAMLQASYLVSAVEPRNSNVETRDTLGVRWDTCNNGVLEIDAVGTTNICSDSAYGSYLDLVRSVPRLTERILDRLLN